MAAQSRRRDAQPIQVPADSAVTDQPAVPGQILPAYDPVVLNAGRPVRELQVTNTGDRPIQVGSHYHFFEANRALRFDRVAAYGLRLDVPAGAAVRFEPGETRSVRLIPLAGTREVWGCNGLVQGALDDPAIHAAALARCSERGFLINVEQGTADG